MVEYLANAPMEELVGITLLLWVLFVIAVSTDVAIMGLVALIAIIGAILMTVLVILKS